MCDLPLIKTIMTLINKRSKPKLITSDSKLRDEMVNKEQTRC